ncbi:MAG: YitT family protein [Pyrinomonadaceae bacterium]|nr:YitT family protein [Pyrinomonadaceae bacterium]
MVDVRTKIINFILIVIGILSAGLGLKGFLVPNRFIDGGVTGTSMLLYEITGFRLSILILLINTPFVIIGYRQIGKKFSIHSAIAIAALAIVIFTFPYPEITTDKLLGAIFGGCFLGLGIGLAMRGGAVLDGTEVVAILTSRKIGITVGDFIFVFNVVLFSTAAFFLGIEKALYSMLTYFAASRMVDFIIHGIEEYNGITIVSEKSSAIRRAILENLGRGVTIFVGRSGRDEVERDILFCVVTRYEIPKIKQTIEEIDARAFVTVQQISDISGGLIRSPLSRVFQSVHESMAPNFTSNENKRDS